MKNGCYMRFLPKSNSRAELDLSLFLLLLLEKSGHYDKDSVEQNKSRIG